MNRDTLITAAVIAFGLGLSLYVIFFGVLSR